MVSSLESSFRDYVVLAATQVSANSKLDCIQGNIINAAFILPERRRQSSSMPRTLQKTWSLRDIDIGLRTIRKSNHDRSETCRAHLSKKVADAELSSFFAVEHYDILHKSFNVYH